MKRYKVVLTETQTKLAVVWADGVEEAATQAEHGEGDQYPDPHPFRSTVQVDEFPPETC